MQRVLRVLLCGLVAFGVVFPAGVASAEPSAQELERQLDKAHEELEVVVEDHNRIGEELKATLAAAAALGERLAPLEDKLSAAHADVAKIAASAYKTGGGFGTANALLAAGKPATMAHQIESIDRVARARHREIAQYSHSKQQYDGEKKRLDDLLRAQTQQQKELADRRPKIEAEIKRLEAMERRLESAGGGSRSTGSTTTAPPPPAGSGKGAVAVRYAHAQLGKMYQWGAEGPNTFDCSGLTLMAWKAAGVKLPHNAAMQYRATSKVTRAALQPGDLVFYRNLGHVGIYAGGGKIIHSSRTGKPVAVVPLDSSGTPYGYSRPG